MSKSLRVATFNTRRMGAPSPDHLEGVTAFIAAFDVDVVALQEVDIAPAEAVAYRAGFSHCTFFGHAPHGRRGVAILHRDAASARSGGRASARWGDDKGFTRVEIHGFEVVALHLDWLSRRARDRQIVALKDLLGVHSARIVLGDLNAMSLPALFRSQIVDDTATELAQALSLAEPYEPIATFPSSKPRWALDWVLASPDLVVDSLRVVPTQLSDHAAVTARVAFRESASPRRADRS